MALKTQKVQTCGPSHEVPFACFPRKLEFLAPVLVSVKPSRPCVYFSPSAPTLDCFIARSQTNFLSSCECLWATSCQYPLHISTLTPFKITHDYDMLSISIGSYTALNIQLATSIWSVFVVPIKYLNSLLICPYSGICLLKV